MYNIRLHGRGGQGAVTGAYILGYTTFLEKKYAQAFPSFGVERTGAPVEAFVRIDEKPIRLREQIKNPDILIIQDPTLIDIPAIFNGTNKNTIAILNSNKAPENPIPFKGKLYCFDITALSIEILGRPIYNTAMLGLFAKVTSLVKLENLFKAIEKQFPKKIADLNITLLQKIYDKASSEPVEYKSKEPNKTNTEKIEVTFDIDPSSTNNNKTGSWGIYYPEVNNEKCIGCGQCQMVCPENCIINKNGQYSANLDFCKACGLCAKVCPVKAIEMKMKK